MLENYIENSMKCILSDHKHLFTKKKLKAAYKHGIKMKMMVGLLFDIPKHGR